MSICVFVGASQAAGSDRPNI